VAKPELNFAGLLRRLRALASLLLTAGVSAPQIPPGLEARAARWRDAVAGQKILLVLDDAAGHEQVRPLLPGAGGSLVLITSRRRLTALEDATVVSIDALIPAEAAALLAWLAGRDDLSPDADTTQEITRLCGYLPLAIGMLARQLRHHPNLHAAVAFAAEARPGHAVAIATAIGGFLRARGHWDQAAGQYQTALGAARRAGDRAGQAGTLDELGLLQQLTSDYPAATATLTQAAALYRELGDQTGEAYALNHLGLVHLDTGGYPAAAASHQRALALARDAGDQMAEAVSLTDLALVQQLTGDFPPAAAGYQRALELFRVLGSEFDQADVLCELGMLQRQTGDYPAAAVSQHEALDLFRRLGDRLGQAWALTNSACCSSRPGTTRPRPRTWPRRSSCTATSARGTANPWR
jgi:tetratricopeptide (TPR) repeat protein